MRAPSRTKLTTYAACAQLSICPRIRSSVLKDGNFGFVGVGVESVRYVAGRGSTVAEKGAGFVERMCRECGCEGEAKGEGHEKRATKKEHRCHGEVLSSG